MCHKILIYLEFKNCKYIFVIFKIVMIKRDYNNTVVILNHYDINQYQKNEQGEFYLWVSNDKHRLHCNVGYDNKDTCVLCK